jgi:2-methylcitrate dehydratase PrpD
MPESMITSPQSPGATQAVNKVLLEKALARFAVETDWDAIPADVFEYVRLLTVDAFGNALAGSTALTVAEMGSAASSLTGEGDYVVLGGRPMSAWAAAGVNAYQTTAFTMCDVYRPALCHITPEVMPAALVAAEMVGASGRDFLEALAIGFEVTTRVCLALDYPAFRARGWHSPGVAGPFGAAAAAGRLLGFDCKEMLGALGLAGAQAAGTFAATGTQAVKFHQLNGARAGLSAAVHARHGFSGSREILTAEDGGLLLTYAGGGTAARASQGLGTSWELKGISMRLYPAASTLQSLIAVLVSLEAQEFFASGKVGEVIVWLPSAGFRLNNDSWDSQLASMQSAQFVTSVVLHNGENWLGSYSVTSRTDPVIGRFASEKVKVRMDLTLPEGGVRVELVGSDSPLQFERLTAPGDSSTPLTSQEVREKLTRSIKSAHLASDPDASALAICDLENVTDIRDLLAQLSAPTGLVIREEGQ